MKPDYLFIVPLILLLSGSAPPVSREINSATLSGDISLTLKHGVWKLWQDKPVYQDITLDLVCDKSRCKPEVWGYAPKFNQDVDHSGTLQAIYVDNAWRVQIKMQIQSHPWQKEIKEADYAIALVPNQGKLIGSYSGTYNNRSVNGAVKGTINPHWPKTLTQHQPIHPREHPRLIFRASQLPELRQKAKTPAGQAILAQLRKTLNRPIHYDSYIPNGGYHATGYCFLAVLNQDSQAAETAWQIVQKSMKQPGRRLLEHSAIVAGVALAYDLCYDAWDQERQKKVTQWLGGQAVWLINGASPSQGWNANVWSNWNARARGASGLAALAILGESEEKSEVRSQATAVLGFQRHLYNGGNPRNTVTPQVEQVARKSEVGKRQRETSINSQRLVKKAERNIKRYLTTAIGDRGFGTEGDHYTTEPWVLTILPFLQAYQNVLGQDLVQGSSAQWFLPHYLMRIVEKDNQLLIPAYGRHRLYAGGSLFAVGLGTVTQPFLPTVSSFYQRHLGMEGDKSFGINSPYQAVFAFVGYQDNIAPKNPAEILTRVLVDEQKGFYVFRNHWQDSNDFVASIYLKRQPLLGSWSFPDVGSFRIWGLGGQWANPGPSEGQWENENVVFMPKTKPWKMAKPTFFQSRPDGSGIVSLRTDNIFRKNSKRPIGVGLIRSFAVDYSEASGTPGLFVVVDKFIGAVEDEQFQDKTWVMHTEGEVTLEKQSFTIQAANGATMKGTFIAPSQVQLSFQKSDNGGKILATGGSEFFVVMTVQKGIAPTVKVSGIGLDATVTVGKQTIYFSADKIVLLR